MANFTECGTDSSSHVNVQNINNPDWQTFFKPGPVNVSRQGDLYKICPYLGNSTTLTVDATVCCNDDQVSIMTSSFQQIDSIFGNSVPLCGVNLKKLWCEYTCNPNKINFVDGVGETTIKNDDGVNVTYTEVTFYVDEDMACTLF